MMSAFDNLSATIADPLCIYLRFCADMSFSIDCEDNLLKWDWDHDGRAPNFLSIFQWMGSREAKRIRNKILWQITNNHRKQSLWDACKIPRERQQLKQTDSSKRLFYDIAKKPFISRYGSLYSVSHYLKRRHIILISVIWCYPVLMGVILWYCVLHSVRLIT